MTQCNKCRSASSCERPWKGMGEHLNCVSFDQIMTNGDGIRTITDEELANKLYLGVCVRHFDDSHECKDSGCKKCWLDWLKEEEANGRTD